MNCEIISVGTEILLGDILDTNSQYLSRRLALLGANVLHKSTVGDNPRRLSRALEDAFRENDTVILTGGLGPTPDDITKEVCAEYFSAELIPVQEICEKIEGFFTHRGMAMPECNKKQALVPKGAVVLDNTEGTAPGFIMESRGRRIIILPGPPSEMIPMFENQVAPYIKELTGRTIVSCSVRTFGIGESAMSERVQPLLELSNPTVAPYAKSGEALLRVTAAAATEEKARELMLPVLTQIRERLGEYIYGVDISSVEEAAVELLKKKGLSVAFAESCTGGLCAKRITDVAGASQVIHFSAVTYSDEVKHRCLGVRKESLEEYSAVSSVVAAEMALNIREKAAADFGVSVTGYAGPYYEGCTDEVGTIYIAVTDGELLWQKKLTTARADRDYNRIVSASNAINELRLCALSYPEKRSEGIDIRKFIDSH